MTTSPSATETPDADGFKPWCLKSSVDNPNVNPNHNLYEKTSCKGKKIFPKYFHKTRFGAKYTDTYVIIFMYKCLYYA